MPIYESMKMTTNNTSSLLGYADGYLRTISNSCGARTAKTYGYSLRCFIRALEDHGVDLNTLPGDGLYEQAITWMIERLSKLKRSPNTEKLYLTVALGFYEYLLAEDAVQINLAKVHLLLKQRSRQRKHSRRVPTYPTDGIEHLIEYALSLKGESVDTDNERLRNLRDRALIITLADTGLRIFEACNLTRGDVDMERRTAVIIGKGDAQALVRFSGRSIRCIQDYLRERTLQLDGKSGKPLESLPLFARHDRGAGKSAKPITTMSGWNIVHQRLVECLGEDYTERIHPHTFRHRFVTEVLRATKNLKTAQEMARHSSITSTQRYAHLVNDELDQVYSDVFDEDDI